MLPTFTLLCSFALAGPPAVQSVCLQVAPFNNEKWTRTPKRAQAVVLIHGFHYHLFDKNVPKAEFRPWQKADSELVKALSKNADVFSFAYGQNVALDTIVTDSKLAPSIVQLRKLGYSDIVLIGHSAGGLIARHFVEDYPDAGVTKVIQVCAPNGGTPLANLAVPKSQKVFLECLRTEQRQKSLERRADKSIPEKVQFLCVVARTETDSPSDGVVPCVSQWTADLRKQGIGAVLVSGTHREVIRESGIANTLARLAREEQQRWSPDQIEKTRKMILGK